VRQFRRLATEENPNILYWLRSHQAVEWRCAQPTPILRALSADASRGPWRIGRAFLPTAAPAGLPAAAPRRPTRQPLLDGREPVVTG
jgi:hypothetical protein